MRQPHQSEVKSGPSQDRVPKTQKEVRLKEASLETAAPGQYPPHTPHPTCSQRLLVSICGLMGWLLSHFPALLTSSKCWGSVFVGALAAAPRISRNMLEVTTEGYTIASAALSWPVARTVCSGPVAPQTRDN